jgi:hypothetical protein
MKRYDFETLKRQMPMSPARSFVALVVAPGASLDAHLGELSEMGGTIKRADSAYAAMSMLCGERIDVVAFEMTEDADCTELLAFLANSRTALLTVIVADPEKAAISASNGVVMLNQPLKAGDLQGAIQSHYEALFSEKREQVRVPLMVPVTVMLGSAQYVATSTDLGHEGIGVRLPVPLPFREVLEVSFELPGTNHKVRASGEISWLDSWGHAGIHIFDLTPGTRTVIATWIAEHRDACTPAGN